MSDVVARLKDEEAYVDAVDEAIAELEALRVALGRARTLIDKFAQCEPINLDEVVRVLTESGELLARQY